MSTPRRSLSFLLTLWLVWGLPDVARACPNCRLGRDVRAAFFDENFLGRLFVVALPLLLVTLVGVALFRLGRPRGASVKGESS